MESVKIQVRRGQVKTGHVRKGDKGGIGADWTDQIRSGQVRSADLEKASSSGSGGSSACGLSVGHPAILRKFLVKCPEVLTQD